MMREFRQTMIVGPEGRIEISTTDLEPGVTVEVVNRQIPEPPKVLTDEEREALFEYMWKLSDEAIANGMETWSIDRVNAKIAQRRAGGCWPDQFDISEIK